MVENISDDDMDLYYGAPVRVEYLRQKKDTTCKHSSGYQKTKKRGANGRWVYTDPQFKAFTLEISFEDSPNILLKEAEGIAAMMKLLSSYGEEFQMSRAMLQQKADLNDLYIKIKLKSIAFVLKTDYYLEEDLTILPRGI